MVTVINGIKLIFLITAGVIYLAGIGWYFTSFVLHGSFIKRRDEISFQHEIPLMLTAGLITNYCLVLIIRSLTISMIIGGILALGGVILFWLSHRYDKERVQVNKMRAITVLVISLLILTPILVEPISAWDARSFWFFHAKMIFQAGSIGPEAGWTNPAVYWSHLDYPKLVPTLAAQISYVLGFWNEYIPKLAIWYLLLPCVIWITGFIGKSLASITLIVLVPMSFFPWIWNGYMDGPLATFFTVALLLLTKYFLGKQLPDLVSALVCIAILPNLKNEGNLAAISIASSLLLSLLLFQRPLKILLNKKQFWSTAFAILLMLTPVIVWTIYKNQWGLVNDLQIGTRASIERIFTRMGDKSYLTILKSEYQQIKSILSLLALSIFAATAWKVRIPKEMSISLIAIFIYILGLTLIYLLTPAELSWHLRSSIDRTILPIYGALIVAVFLQLKEFEGISSPKLIRS